MRVDELKTELKVLREKREKDNTIKNLKRQIRAEKFGQTKSGKIFNKIANVGEAGYKVLKKIGTQPQQTGKKKKKNKSVKEIMASLPK